MNSDSSNPQKFSDEAHKVAMLATELWRSNPEITGLEKLARGYKDRDPYYIGTMRAINLLRMAERNLEVQPRISDQERLEAGRFYFQALLEQDTQANLPNGSTRALGRITSKAKLKVKICEVFPSRRVFLRINEMRDETNADGGVGFDKICLNPDMLNHALKSFNEQGKSSEDTIMHLMYYAYSLENGFTPSKSKGYPSQDDFENETLQLFRASEDIIHSDRLSTIELDILSKACHTSKVSRKK